MPRSNVQPGTAQCNPIVSISPFCVQCHAPLPPTHSLLPPPRRHHTFTTATHTFTPKKTPRCSKHSLIIFHNPPPKRKMFFITFYSFSAQPLVATQVWLADHFTVDKAIRSTVKSATWLYCSSSLNLLAIHILHCYEVWYKLDLINCANIWPRILEHFLGKYTNIWWQIFGEKYFMKIFSGRL